MGASRACEACGHGYQQDKGSGLPFWLPCANPECTPGEALVYLHMGMFGAERVRYLRHLAHDPTPGLEATGYAWAREGAEPDLQVAKRWIAEERDAKRAMAAIRP